MSAFQTVAVPVTTTGTAGSATGSATSESLFGYLIDIYLDFHASAPDTTDVTVAYALRGGAILAVSNSKTDARYAPRSAVVDSAGAAISGAHDRHVLNQALTVSVAQCDALATAVTAYITVGRP